MNYQQEKHSHNGHHPQATDTDVKQMLGQDEQTTTAPTGLINPKAVWQQQSLPTSEPTPTHPNNAPTIGDSRETLKAELLEHTNAERQQEGVPPLQLSPQLSQAAQRHAEDMARNGFCGHTGSDGSSVSERVTAVGYSFSCVGENCAAGQSNPEEVVQGWMKSPGHCRNILNPDYTEIGFGYVSDPSSSHHYYWVQVFGRGSGELQVTTPPDSTISPDFWNKALVAVLLTFYFASLVSTYVSTNLLLYLLSGGAAITVPMLGTQFPITEAVALMGTGILEGTSLSDAYLEHKKHLTGSRKWASRGGRLLAFIGQGLLYYMALGQLLFATADVNSLGAQGLEDYEKSSRTEAALILDPPTPLHGAFVGTLSFAWSFGTTYMGPTALLVGIDRLRRKRSQAQKKPGFENGLPTKHGEQQANVKSLLSYWHDQINKEIQIHLYNKLMEHQIEELKLLQRAIDRGLIEIANLPEQIRRHGLGIAQNTPVELLEKASLTPDQAVSLFKQPTMQVLPPNTTKTLPTLPSDWKQTN